MGILDALSKHSMFSEILDTYNKDPSTGHQMKGYDFAQNFPGAVPGGVYTPTSFLGPMLSKGYQYGQELGKSILDGPGNYTMGQAWDEAGRQSDENIQGMLEKGVNKNMYNNFIAEQQALGNKPQGLGSIIKNALRMNQAQASIPTRDDMIKAGITKQMINEGTATPMGRRYGNMSMGYGRPNYVADKSPVQQGLKEIEIGMAPFVANRMPSQQDLSSDFFMDSITKDSKFYDPYKPTFKDQIKKGYGKYAKPVIGGIMSAVSGIPGIGLLMNAFNRPDPYAQNRIDMYGAYRDSNTGFIKDKFGYNVGKTLMKNRFLEPGSNSYRSYALDAMRGMKNKNALDNYYQKTYNKSFGDVYKDHQKKKDPFNNTNPFAGTADNFSGGNQHGQSYSGKSDRPGGSSSFGQSFHGAKGGIASLWRR